MWRKRAHKLAHLTKICSTKVNLKWTDVEKTDFTAMKKIVGRDVLLYYPNFSEKFITHTVASKNATWRNNESKWETHCFLFTQINPCTNKLCHYIKRAFKWSGNPKRVPYNYVRTPYNSIYGP